MRWGCALASPGPPGASRTTAKICVVTGLVLDGREVFICGDLGRTVLAETQILVNPFAAAEFCCPQGQPQGAVLCETVHILAGDEGWV